MLSRENPGRLGAWLLAGTWAWLGHMASQKDSSSSKECEADSDGGAGDGYVEIKEGCASILFPSSNEVFYNPVQEFNRDLR